ncbi:Uncharacterised protein [Mycobacterium tuberculosis]|nr:Uncharacterised protein [Mycobacterium tuberculosis]
MIPHHRTHVLSPHLHIIELSGRNRRRVLTQNVRRHQRPQQHPIRRPRRRMPRRRQRRLKRRRRRGSLTSRQLRLPGRRTQPPHIRRRRPRHRHRRRTRPRPSRQPGDHRIKRGRRGPQIRSQPLPRPPRHKQRPRPRTGIDPRRVDLRRQPRKIQNHRNPKPASRLNGSDTNQSRMLKQPTPKIRVLKKVLTPRGMIGVLTCRRARATRPPVLPAPVTAGPRS